MSETPKRCSMTLNGMKCYQELFENSLCATSAEKSVQKSMKSNFTHPAMSCMYFNNGSFKFSAYFIDL